MIFLQVSSFRFINTEVIAEVNTDGVTDFQFASITLITKRGEKIKVEHEYRTEVAKHFITPFLKPARG